MVLVDAARQHADLAQVAGVGPISGGTVAEVLAGKCRAADALRPVRPAHCCWRTAGRPGRVPIIRATRSSGCWRTADASRRGRRLVVDAGSGLSSWTRRFWLRARWLSLVTTTDDVAVMDTYAAIKLSAAESLASDIRVLVNQCDSSATADDVTNRLAAACQRFLGRQVPALPALPRHIAIDAAGTMRVPRVWESPHSPFGHAVLWLGHAVDDVLTANVSIASCASLAGVEATASHVHDVAAIACRPDYKSATTVLINVDQNHSSHAATNVDHRATPHGRAASCQFGEIAASLTAALRVMMGRIYAGILGPLAMAVVICRGLMDSGGVEGTLTIATISLAAFAVARCHSRAYRPNHDRRIGAHAARAAACTSAAPEGTKEAAA